MIPAQPVCERGPRHIVERHFADEYVDPIERQAGEKRMAGMGGRQDDVSFPGEHACRDGAQVRVG